MPAKKPPTAPDAPVALQAKTAENADAYAAARAQSATVAASKLRDAHREEHDEFMAKAMAERGFLWEPRPTGKRAALLKMQALAKEFGLGVEDLVAAGLVPAEEPEPEPEREPEPVPEGWGSKANAALAERAASLGVEVHAVPDPDAR
jgi:hypothetical protein